jgi:hypothetical protein
MKRSLAMAWVCLCAIGAVVLSGCGASVGDAHPKVTASTVSVPARGVMGESLRIADSGFGFDFVITVEHCYWPVRIGSANVLGAEVDLTITNEAATPGPMSTWDDLLSSFRLHTEAMAPEKAGDYPTDGGIADQEVKPGRTVAGALYFVTGDSAPGPTALSLQLNSEDAAATWELVVTKPPQ